VSETPLLHQIRFSHFNEKARWALDYKGIPHRRKAALPGMHVIKARRLYGGVTFPVLELDGEVVPGSDKIIDRLEERWPEPALYPAHPVQRRLALELQQYFGEEVAPQLRSFMFFYLLPESGQACALFSEGFPAPARAAFRAAYPANRIAFRRALKADAETAEDGRRRLLAALDRIESEVGPSGYLVGDSFSVADLAGAATLFPFVRPEGTQYPVPDSWPAPVEELRTSLADRDAFKWVEEMWRRHRGGSAEVGA
jgi:glutathione S-transferase